MRTIKIKFDLWYKRMTPERFFKRIPYVLKRYNLKLSNSPDIIFYGNRSPHGKFKKVFYTCDNVRPNIKKSDIALAFDYEENVKGNNYFRLPNYARLGAGNDLIKKNINIEEIIENKTEFCAFIYAHNVPIRNEFFKALCKYKKVHAPGSACNNHPPIGKYSNAGESRKSLTMYEDKTAFLRKYKFAIVFENSSYSGYTTEKIYHAMLAGCIPIYWGNPNIGRDFNPKSIISAYNNRNLSTQGMFKYLIDRVVEVDNNNKLHFNMLKQPWYNNNKLNPFVGKDRMIKIFDQVFDV